jgi:hypothetical protein
MLISVAALSKAWVFGRLVTGFAGSNPAEGMDISLVFICCVVLCRQRPLRRADHWSRGVLPCVTEISIHRKTRLNVSCSSIGRKCW